MLEIAQRDAPNPRELRETVERPAAPRAQPTQVLADLPRELGRLVLFRGLLRGRLHTLLLLEADPAGARPAHTRVLRSKE